MSPLKEYHERLILDMRDYILNAIRVTRGDKCQGCGKWQQTYEIHHLRYAPDITINDLLILCDDCHSMQTSQSHEHHMAKEPHCATCSCYN